VLYRHTDSDLPLTQPETAALPFGYVYTIYRRSAKPSNCRLMGGLLKLDFFMIDGESGQSLLT
jgi:hypothetical protein